MDNTGGNGVMTVYSTAWCGYCVRLKHQLDAAGLPYSEVDIEADDAAVRLVEEANGGNRTVPTVVLPDGRALTNPTLPQITAHLAAVRA